MPAKPDFTQWPKDRGRFVCTAERPMPQGAPGQWTHHGARVIGEDAEGCCDFMQCDDCGVQWRKEYSA